MAKLHPLVAAFCETGEQLSKLVKSVPCPGDAPVEVIRKLLTALRGEIQQEEGLKIARSAPLDGIDPNLAILTIGLWAHLLESKDRAIGTRALFKRALDFRTPDTPHPVWRVIAYLDMHSVYQAGNKRRAEELCREMLDTMPPDSPHRVFALTEYATLLANKGRVPEVEAELAAAADEHKRLAHLFRGIRLIQSIETCQLDEAARLLPEMEAESAFATTNAARIEMAHALLALVRGEGAPPDCGRPEIAPMEMLLSRRPEDALTLIRGQSVEWLELYHTDAAFTAFNLVRAELACRHVEAARRVLRIRRDIGNDHPLDDFFLARLELLSGNREAATRHFAAVLRYAEKYHAGPRLDFELRFACELAPGELLWLARTAERLPAAAAAGPPSPVPSPAPLRGTARLVGDSPAMEQTRHAVLQYAPLEAPVLITGETGTGKEEVAHAIHECGPRAGQPFIAINCGSITESLLVSELFGHERGAFTGAQRSRKGLFEEAGKGTILLDEIGDISPGLQVALLRVLEAGEVRPVGSGRSHKVACRIIAATNADLTSLVARGLFRQDLVFRLRRLEIFMPPMRERREDILTLVDHFLCLGRSDARRPALSEDLRTRLRSLDWPGNVREIRNTVERLRLLNSEKLSYDASDLDGLSIGAPAGGQSPVAAPSGGAPVASPLEKPTEAGPAGDAVLSHGRTAMRRLDRMRDHFRRHGKLTRAEIVRLLGVSGPTATSDLKALLAEGLIERVMPSASRRSHYFRLRSLSP